MSPKLTDELRETCELKNYRQIFLKKALIDYGLLTHSKKASRDF